LFSEIKKASCPALEKRNSFQDSNPPEFDDRGGDLKSISNDYPYNTVPPDMKYVDYPIYSS
jgi:hypothetical protein